MNQEPEHDTRMMGTDQVSGPLNELSSRWHLVWFVPVALLVGAFIPLLILTSIASAAWYWFR